VHKASLQLPLADGLPDFQGDGTQVRQVLMNLVLNASEALGDKGGTITVRTGVVQEASEPVGRAKFHELTVEGRCVFVEVSDDGCGMDAATQARIFDPFYTTKFTGRGLGLAAVLGIVRGHKGTIRVFSEVDRGTTIKVLFPAIDQPAIPSAPVAHATKMEKNSGAILLVDDEQTVRQVAQKILTSSGYEVIAVADGAEAVAVFRRDPARFAAVLLDLTMPHMDGEEAFRVLKETHPAVRVLIMSGFNEQDTISRFVGRGVAGFLPKPFSADMLLTRLRDVLAGRDGLDS